MGIFSNILHKIFPANHPSILTAALQGAMSGAAAATSSSVPSAAPATPTPTMATPGVAPVAVSSSAPMATNSSAPATSAANLPPVDVEAILNAKAEQKGGKLNWRTSIVDLLKLLDLDSSLSARKELAQELNYTGDMNDSATMNIWLQKQVMNKLAENGGQVPADLKAA